MPRDLDIRLLTPEDLCFADRLRAEAGWNQTLGDWRRFIELEPEGCFLAEWNGKPAGTATTIIYNETLAWVGMVLVHPDYRRKGIGTALLGRCLEFSRARQAGCIKLDATPVGKTLYQKLGFREEWSLSRWECPGLQDRFVGCGSCLRQWERDDSTGISSFDAQAFGISRRRLLASLAPQSREALVLWRQGEIAGYGLLRDGARALYLGPVVARGATDGIPLLNALANCCGGKSVFWDIPETNTAAKQWAKANGFIRQRRLTRMYLGMHRFPGEPRRFFALSGPETG